MADTIAIPTYVELMLPTLKAIRTLGGSGTSNEIDDAVIAQEGLTDEQLAVVFPPTAKQTGSKVIHRCAWARTYLKKAGAIDNSQRGVWTLEPTARNYLAMPDEEAARMLRQADADARRQARQRRAITDVSTSTDEVGPDSSDDDGADDDLPAEADSDWKTTLINLLKRLEPAQFERLTGRLLREVGFTKVEVLGRSDDKGIDGRGLLQMTPLTSLQVFFQCKRYEDPVGPGHVRDFRGAMTGRGIQGLIITTSSFTPKAKEEATRDGAPLIDLIDGDELCDLLKSRSLGLNIEQVERVTLDPAFFQEI